MKISISPKYLVVACTSAVLGGLVVIGAQQLAKTVNERLEKHRSRRKSKPQAKEPVAEPVAAARNRNVLNGPEYVIDGLLVKESWDKTAA